MIMEAVLERLFKNSADKISVQAVRYVLAGTAACVVDYVSLIIYVEILKLHYLTAAALAFLSGAAVSYTLSIFWIFNKRTFKNTFLEASIFLVLVIAGLALNHLCIWFFSQRMGIHYLFSKGISTVMVASVNFSARKFILFR